MMLGHGKQLLADDACRLPHEHCCGYDADGPAEYGGPKNWVRCQGLMKKSLLFSFAFRCGLGWHLHGYRLQSTYRSLR